jgi:hypothetical protein
MTLTGGGRPPSAARMSAEPWSIVVAKSLQSCDGPLRPPPPPASRSDVSTETPRRRVADAGRVRGRRSRSPRTPPACSPCPRSPRPQHDRPRYWRLQATCTGGWYAAGRLPERVDEGRYGLSWPRPGHGSGTLARPPATAAPAHAVGQHQQQVAAAGCEPPRRPRRQFFQGHARRGEICRAHTRRRPGREPQPIVPW